jgi:hypothetical protein
MLETLEDESGENPLNKISWTVIANKDDEGNPYNIGSISGDVTISSTKTPYIPNDLYKKIGKNTFDGNKSYYRCCTPIDINDDGKYDGFINYSMCQATGYKLKSNKELPCAFQVFSKLIPETSHAGGKDTANGNQLYPMYSVLEFVHDRYNNIEAIDVKMCRVTNIFLNNGSDSFTQTNYGKNAPGIEYLVEANEANSSKPSAYMYGLWISNMSEDKFLYIKY